MTGKVGIVPSLRLPFFPGLQYNSPPPRAAQELMMGKVGTAPFLQLPPHRFANGFNLQRNLGPNSCAGKA
jgi:hypothetical protein